MEIGRNEERRGNVTCLRFDVGSAVGEPVFPFHFTFSEGKAST